MKEYWVIEDSRTGSVFGPGHGEAIKGYIPRKAGESVIGRKTRKDECLWLSREESEAMRLHPEFVTKLPEAENE